MTSGGPLIPGYGDLRVLGRGGFAVVYSARQLAFDREVAIKVLDRSHADDRALDLFTRECRAIGSLSWHPHVVPVHDAGQTEDGRAFLAMELLPGGSVAEAMERGALHLSSILRIAREVADAVGAAHDLGVLHRDLKPANILIDRRGSARLADFGIARIMGADSTTIGAVTGTVAFMAPELLMGERASFASDVYGLGITVATMLLGRNPFVTGDEETPFAIMQRVATSAVPDLREVGTPGPLADLIHRCLAREPSHRPASAHVVHEALVELSPVVGGAVAATAILPGPPSPPPVDDRPTTEDQGPLRYDLGAWPFGLEMRLGELLDEAGIEDHGATGWVEVDRSEEEVVDAMIATAIDEWEELQHQNRRVKVLPLLQKVASVAEELSDDPGATRATLQFVDLAARISILGPPASTDDEAWRALTLAVAAMQDVLDTPGSSDVQVVSCARAVRDRARDL